MSHKWEILKDKGNEAFKKKDYKLALSLYSDSIKLDPHQDSSYSNRGLCYMSIGKFTQAKSDLNKAVTLNSKNIKALKRLAQVHLALGELSEALLFLKRCIEVEPKDESHKNDVNIVKDLISCHEELTKAKFIYDYKTCEANAAELLKKCTEATSIKLIYLESLIRNCKPGEALTFYKEKLNSQENRKEEVQFLLCEAYYQDGKYEKAKQILTQLIAMSTDANLEKYKQLWDNLKLLETEKEKANDCFKKGDYDGAILLYTKLLEIDSNNKNFNSTILANRALCYQKKNKTFDALKDINKSIELNENYWKAYYRRATLHITLKNPTKAKEDLEKVIKLDSNNRDAVLLLDDILREEKKSKKKDLYKILDISHDASSDEIRKSYRKLAGKWHPDKNSETEEMRAHAERMFKDVNEAYKVLSDPKTRRIYDDGGDPDDPNFAFHTKNEEDHQTFDDILNSYYKEYNFTNQKSDHHQNQNSKFVKDKKHSNSHSKDKKDKKHDNSNSYNKYRK